MNTHTFSDDAVAYGCDLAFEFLTATRGRKELLKRAPHQLPPPAAFSIKDPEHVVAMAFFGFQLLPHDRGGVSEDVAERGAFTRTVKARISEAQHCIADYNRGVEKRGLPPVSVDPRKRQWLKQRPSHDPEMADVIKACKQLDTDNAYLKASHAGRLDYFAKELGQPNFSGLMQFVAELNAVASAWGYGSYGTLVVPKRFIAHHLAACEKDSRLKGGVAFLRESQHQLKNQSPLVITLVVTSHSENDTFKVEWDGTELQVTFRDGNELHREFIGEKFLANDDSLQLFEHLGVRAE